MRPVRSVAAHGVAPHGTSCVGLTRESVATPETCFVGAPSSTTGMTATACSHSSGGRSPSSVQRRNPCSGRRSAPRRRVMADRVPTQDARLREWATARITSVIAAAATMQSAIAQGSVDDETSCPCRLLW